MALRFNSITAQFGKLPFTISRTSLRCASTASTANTATPPKPKSQHPSAKREREIAKSIAPGHHGEKIWVFTHFLNNLVIYSLKPVMKAHDALRQIPFSGRKSKPSQFRKDYWRVLAMIQLPEGQGDVGLSVYQRLRECKRLHELSWRSDILFDGAGNPLRKSGRVIRINDQKANAIADISVVLAGEGKGNRMWVDAAEQPAEAEAEAEAEATTTATSEEPESGAKKDEEAAAKDKEEEDAEEDKEDVEKEEKKAPEVNEEGKVLLKAEVWWADEQDRNYAETWTSNVTHHLFENAALEKMGPGGMPGLLPEEPEEPEEGEGAREEEDDDVERPNRKERRKAMKEEQRKMRREQEKRAETSEW